jgi:hypothetical protein
MFLKLFPKRKKPLLFLSLIISVIAGSAQVSIQGIQCVATGVDYQYNIKVDWKEGDRVRVCVEGGIITINNNSCMEKDFMSSIRVRWSQGVGRKITVSSRSGTSSLEVKIAKALEAGEVITEDRQELTATNIPSDLICTPASGGSCAPTYNYQWEQSTDRLGWKPVNGATNKDLQFSAPLATSSYFRRKVIEMQSMTIGYSEIIELTVLPPAR